jgi:hypothetical protein
MVLRDAILIFLGICVVGAFVWMSVEFDEWRNK